MNKKVSKENFHGRPPYGSVSCFLCCPTLRSTKKGLALVLKRLNYAGSEFFEIVCVTLSKSSTNHFCFPLLLALHTWLLCSVFKVRFQLLYENGMVGPSGLEPPTSRLSVVRSSQLSYGPILDFSLLLFFLKRKNGGDKRDRTVDPLLAKQVLSQLSYTPIFRRPAPSKLNNVSYSTSTKRLT